jgi:hypothetical protein
MQVLFRAKEKNSNNYVIGYEYYNHVEDEYYITHYVSGSNYKIDRTTRSINIEDMLDSQGNKIFASLQKDGRGGDVCSVNDYIHGGLKGIAIYQNYGFRIDRKGKAMGISLSSTDIKIIGIQQ